MSLSLIHIMHYIEHLAHTLVLYALPVQLRNRTLPFTNNKRNMSYALPVQIRNRTSPFTNNKRNIFYALPVQIRNRTSPSLKCCRLALRSSTVRHPANTTHEYGFSLPFSALPEKLLHMYMCVCMHEFVCSFSGM